MFNNIGGKIKGLAKVIFIISVIVWAICALIAAIGTGIAAAESCGSYRYPDSAAGFLAGFGIFILGAGIGFLVSWIGSFFMYGLGQLIEDTEINRRTNQQILAKLSAAPAAPACKAEPAAPVVPAEPAKPKTWICRSCGTENEESSLFCFNCGTRKA